MRIWILNIDSATSVIEIDKNEIANIYPNPLTSSSTLQLNTQLKDAEVIIYDMLGKEVFTSSENIYTAGVQQIELNAGGLADGAYLCVLRIGNETRSIRVLINKQ